ncbi:sensor histidine kinase [Sulfuricurvum sp.]|uniref:sensor histidine kinase n=1 Tax=Sulfuricurvum sp. TaxID=2025608 RepID=UPI002D75B5C9|nr:sensor histidine kinase [Sulfuricurvum sp.]HZF70327.1 sensor histidine kinase [Sulfuricurvum sp.]
MKKLIFLFIVFTYTLQASIHVLQDALQSPIEKSISYMEDSKGDLTYQQVQYSHFIPYTQERSLNFGFTKSVYWFKIDLQNRSAKDDTHWWIKIDYPLLELIDIYLIGPDHRVIKYKRMGTSQSFASREIASHNFISELPLQNISNATLLIRVKTQSSMQLPLAILSSEKLLEETEQNNLFVGGYYGIFFIVLLYNIVLYIYTRDQNYLRYILFITSFILWQLSFDGLGIKYLWGDDRWLIDHGSSALIAFTAFCALYFSRYFLNTVVYAPKIDKAIILVMLISLVMSVASAIFPYGDVIPINAALASLIPIILLIAGVVVMRHEHRAARFYVAGWSSFLIATIIFAFNKFDLIPTFYGVNHVQQIGSAIEMIFLSLALADRVYLLQREYIGKLNRLNDTLTEKVEVALNEARMKDRLFVQQSRLAAMGEMIEQIAHQWRQPLHTLALINQDMYINQKLGKCDNECFEQSHSSIDEHLQYLSKTIDDFRNFYKTDKSKSLEDLGKLAVDALRLSDVFLKYAKIKTELHVSAVNKVNIAKNEMVQVLMNLIKNSHDAIVEQRISDGKIMISVEDFGSGVKISVEDNAGGIAPNVMEKIFDIYFTTKDPDHGTGLGLHMSKYIIEESFGGKISVENIPGGARFVIFLIGEEEQALPIHDESHRRNI